jgi:Tol biopolymer transport system component
LLVGGVALAQASTHLRLVSSTSSGASVNGDSSTEGGASTISRDGKFVAFESKAPSLPGGNGTVEQIYVKNLETGKVRLASEDNQGDPAASDVFGPAISANGRFVAFYGPGGGLPHSNGIAQVWVHDVKTGRTRLVSADHQGNPGTASGSSYPSLSAGGRYVAFTSGALDLPAGDGSVRAYEADVKTGRVTLVSRTNKGKPASAQMYGQSVSGDGSLVAFYSTDARLPRSNGSYAHVYLRDMDRGRTTILDLSKHGKAGNGAGYDPSLSANGRFVGFDSYSMNLPGGTGQDEAYLLDRRTGRLRELSRTNSGHPANGNAYYAKPAADGKRVVFEATAANLPGGDGTNGFIYVRDLRSGKTLLASRAGNGDPPNDYAEYGSISADGRWVSFYSAATNLGGNTLYTNVFRESVP